LDIPELDCWRRDRNDSITFCNAWVYALYDAKGKVSAFFSRSFKKHQKKRQYYNSIGSASAMQCFFEVGLFTGAVWLGVLNNQSAANQIALSFTPLRLCSLFAVAATIRVGNQKGLGEATALLPFYILLAVIVESFRFNICFVS
jgi:MATE family multidrug resistance protein